MGCEACRQSEPEANFPLINLEVKSNDRQNETSSEKKHNYDNFTLLLKINYKILENILNKNLIL